jgi:hypothetical protein
VKTNRPHHPNQAANLFAATKLFIVCGTGFQKSPLAAHE